MFMCEWCENYRDKSESRENPKDDCSNICDECADENEELLNRCSIHGVTIDRFFDEEYNEFLATSFACGKCNCTLYFDDEDHEDGLCEECFIENKKYNLG